MLIGTLHTAARVCGCVGGIVLALVAFGVMPKVTVAQSQPYVFQPVSVPVSRSTIRAVNSSSQMVGTYVDASGVEHGFFYANGQLTNIDVPGAETTFPDDINDAGQVVGFYEVTINSPCCVNQSHGFLWSGGQFTFLPDYPGGAYVTQPAAINNSGVIVGFWGAINNDLEGGGFVFANGAFTQINYPGDSPSCAAVYGIRCSTFPEGINDAGEIVGVYYLPSDNAGGSHAFLLSAGQYSNIDPPGVSCANQACGAYGVSGSGVVGIVGGSNSYLLNAGVLTPTLFTYPGASSTTIAKMNSQGWVLGSFYPGGQFLALPAALVDPVPDLMSTVAPTTLDDSGLARNGLGGRVVQGIAADATAEVIVRIPAVNIGDQFTINLINDQGGQGTPTEDGALGNPGDTTFTQNEITVNAIGVNGPNGTTVPMAFAVYRAPVDFARGSPGNSYKSGTCYGVTDADSNLACRSVTLQIENQTEGTTANLPVTILRPPVVMIHGLWDTWTTWNNFSPLVSGPRSADPRFSIGRVDYSWNVGQYITGSDPAYPADVLSQTRANSLGFVYNAQFILSQINAWIGTFKLINNPLGIPAADVQADVITHSMGGDIARTIALQTTFPSASTFGQGNIHKLITIDTPHLGSPLANDLLSSQERGGCVETQLAIHNRPALNLVQFGGSAANGAIADLQVGSSALTAMANGQTPLIPTALIAGINPNFDAVPPALAAFCYAKGDALASADFSASAWTQTVFLGQLNDGVVTEASQLDGLNSQFVFSGVDHSAGIEGFLHLGFAGPNVLEPDSQTGIPSTVINLLNTPVANSAFFLLNP